MGCLVVNANVMHVVDIVTDFFVKSFLKDHKEFTILTQRVALHLFYAYQQRKAALV